MAADFGDAPLPYATLLAENGARHEAVGPMLGATRDTEADGVHSAAANGDGTDEDGVIFSTMRVGQLGATATVNVQNAAAGAKLDGWIDFNGDGVWGGPGEQVANNLAVVNGQNTVTFDVPGTAVAGSVVARFRLSTAGNLSPKGAAVDGEVEDYAVTIGGPTLSSGTFGPLETVVAPGGLSGSTGRPHAVHAADVDGDGDMDLLTASYPNDKVAWYENNGSQTFTERVITTAADGARSVWAADLDGDGDMDVVAALETANKVVWYQNNGSQVFTALDVSTGPSGGPRTVMTADVDGDGDVDVVTAAGNRLHWYENNGSQTFTDRLLPASPTNVIDVDVADVDKDGDLDFLWAAAIADNNVGWYENNGSQVFTARKISDDADGARNVAAADVDGDGDMDVVVAALDAGSVLWFENNGSEAFTKRTVSTNTPGAWSVFVADMDGDGDMDVVSASSTNDTIALHVNDGSETFSIRTVSTAIDLVQSVYVADVDDDGDFDVISASPQDGEIAWFENKPAGDYDANGDVDGRDFLVWQRSFGSTAVPPGSGADGSGNGTVDALDLTLWSSGFGSAQGSAAAHAERSSEALMVSDFRIDDSPMPPPVQTPRESNVAVKRADLPVTQNAGVVVAIANTASMVVNAAAIGSAAPSTAQAGSGNEEADAIAELDEAFAEWTEFNQL